MPIYEYECTACAHNFEIIQRMSDTPLIDCPACAKPQLRKKLSAAAFHLKGSGWYQTDFKGGTKPPVESESGTTSEAKEAKGEGKDGAGSKETASKESAAEPKTTPPKTPDSSAA